MPHTNTPDSWKVALDIRAREAEEKFQRGEQLTAEDITVMALVHPDKFEIQIQLKGTASAPDDQAHHNH